MRAIEYTLLGVAAIGLAACSNYATAPGYAGYPPIGGTYAASITETFSNANQTETLSIPATIWLSDAASNGQFSGSYSFAAPFLGSGQVFGDVAPDGSVRITEFGDPGAPPLADIGFLQSEWPFCDYSSLGSSGMAGSLAGNVLTLDGSLDFSCAYTNGSTIATFPTTLSATISAGY